MALDLLNLVKQSLLDFRRVYLFQDSSQGRLIIYECPNLILGGNNLFSDQNLSMRSRDLTLSVLLDQDSELITREQFLKS